MTTTPEAGAPAPAPLTSDRFRVLAGGKVAASVSGEWVEACVQAATAYVASLPHAGDLDPAAAEWGTYMLALRLVRRGETPTGLQTAGDAGIAYVARYDPDVSRALRLGAQITVG